METAAADTTQPQSTTKKYSELAISNGTTPMQNGHSHQNGSTKKKKKGNVSIFALGTANPEFVVLQSRYVDFVLDCLNIPAASEIGKSLSKLGDRTGIEKRYFIRDDANKKRGDWTVIPNDFPQTNLGMSVRNKLYCSEAPKLAIAASRKAIEEWGGDVKDITHIIAISCTGVMAPGIEFFVMQELGLKRTVQRIGINLMGCFGAFRGMATAKALAREDPKNRILMVCTELCSIHFQAEMTLETFVGNALFADGAAALVIGDCPTAQERPFIEIEDTGSFILENSPTQMTWEAADTGFVMRLSAKVPDSIKTGVPEFVNSLLADRCEPTECGYAIHPGGKAIIQGIEDALKLQKWQTQCSWDTLRDFGNMSSVTFLFVLDNLRKNKPKEQTAPYVVGMGFGPGLALEGAVLKWSASKEE